MHTYHSDGVLSPIELLDKSKDNGIDCISITDHDSVNGIAEAIEYGKKLGIEVIPGLELSTDIEDREVHLLAYFVDIDDLELTKYLSFFRDERFERAKRIVKKLNKLGIDITIDHVLNESKNSSIGRPHVALAMIRLGVVSDYYEAFQKYLRDNGPAYERKIHLSPQSALKLISDSGGLSFIAHPGHLKESVMMNLINTGIDGIEVIHPSHNDYQINFYRGIVNQYCLLESGGSDFHGGKREDESNFGKYSIPQIKVEAMKNMLHNRE
ncbi:MAG: PHP domain-containing protein [Bacteroidota bacterium]